MVVLNYWKTNGSFFGHSCSKILLKYIFLTVHNIFYGSFVRNRQTDTVLVTYYSRVLLVVFTNGVWARN